MGIFNNFNLYFQYFSVNIIACAADLTLEFNWIREDFNQSGLVATLNDSFV